MFRLTDVTNWSELDAAKMNWPELDNVPEGLNLAVYRQFTCCFLRASPIDIFDKLEFEHR